MVELNTILKSQSFPSVDVRVAWAITLICLIVGLLLTLGVLTVQIGTLPGWAWIAIIPAQVLTAVAVAGATRLSSRRRANVDEAPGTTAETAG